MAHADPKHELEIFTRLSGLPNVLQLQDHFSLQGPNGVHTVLVSNVLGNLRSVIRLSKGPRHNLVRKLCHDITFGLAALHRQGIVHGGMYQLARCYPLTWRVRSPHRQYRDLLAQFEQPPPRRYSRPFWQPPMYDYPPNNLALGAPWRNPTVPGTPDLCRRLPHS